MAAEDDERQHGRVYSNGRNGSGQRSAHVWSSVANNGRSRNRIAAAVAASRAVSSEPTPLNAAMPATIWKACRIEEARKKTKMSTTAAKVNPIRRRCNGHVRRVGSGKRVREPRNRKRRSSGQQRAVQAAPHDELPVRPVPQSAEQHGEHQVDVRAPAPVRLPPSGM